MVAPLDAHGWLTLVTCAGVLAFVVLAARRAAKSPLALPLAFLGLVLFASNGASLAFDLTGSPAWNRFDAVITPLAPPIALHFILTFVGRRRTLGWVMIAGYGAFGAISIAAAASLFATPLRAFPGSDTWSLLYLVGLVPVVAAGVLLFSTHWRQSANLNERQRTRLLLLAFALLALLGSTDLLDNLIGPLPRLGTLGAFLCTALLGLVALRLKLFDVELASSSLLYAVVLGGSMIWAYAATFRWLEESRALLIFATAILTLALVAAGRRWLSGAKARQDRVAQLALIGRFTAQMAHDLKNPLAAAKGAAQFLLEERARGQSLADQGDFFQLLVDQLDRLGRVLDGYGRLARVEPDLQRVDLNALIPRVLALQRFSKPGVAVKSELRPGALSCQVDPDLIAASLENLIRNAIEAMPEGGTVTVRCAPFEPEELVISVEDTGSGMDARTAERVFDDFFTTKATGSGLGLALVRRVAEAHGGRASLSTVQGKGTTIRIHLPSGA